MHQPELDTRCGEWRTSPTRFPDEIKVCLSSASPLETTDQREGMININLKLRPEAELDLRGPTSPGVSLLLLFMHLRITWVGRRECQTIALARASVLKGNIIMFRP